MRKITCALALSFAVSAHAAPFLLSDAWLLADSLGNELPQPDTCQSVEGTAAAKPLTLLTTATGAKYIKQDLTGTTNGSHKLTITCKSNLWGVASAPVDFSFVAGAPTLPAGLRVAP